MKRLLAILSVVVAFTAFAQERRVIRCDFTSQPDGASVVVDDVMRGVTPLTLYDLGPGRHHVRYEMAGYEDVDDIIVLTLGGFVQKNAVMNPVKGLLLLTSEPSECDISLDGYSLGRTPRLIASLDAKNVYSLVVQKPGYQPRSVEVKFNGRSPLVKHETLIIDSGVIEVTSDPEGADVVVNGLSRGVTPLTVSNVPKGRATVTIGKKGFDSTTRELSVTPGERQSLFVKLDGRPGTMLLSSIPEGARFYVNNRPEGRGPVSLTNLKPGTYSIRVEMDGFATARKTIELENGGSVAEEFRMTNVMGRIEVRTIPSGVQVLLDGTFVGVTKDLGDEMGPSDLLAIENVREGEHTLVLKRNGYADVTKHPVVENQKTQSVNVRMKRVFTPDVEIITGNGVYRGILISNTPDGVELEVSLGINRMFQHSEIRKLNFLK